MDVYHGSGSRSSSYLLTLLNTLTTLCLDGFVEFWQEVDLRFCTLCNARPAHRPTKNVPRATMKSGSWPWTC